MSIILTPTLMGTFSRFVVAAGPGGSRFDEVQASLVGLHAQGTAGFDGGGKVRHVVAKVAAQVLDEPVEQRGEAARLPKRLTADHDTLL